MFYKKKEYYSVNKWVGIFNKNYKDMGIKVDSHILHHLFNYYKIPHINVNKKGEICKDGGITMYPVRLVENMMYQKETFIRNLKGIIDYWDEYEIRKEVDERNKLRNNRKSIKISEAAYNRLFEGASFTKNDDNTINLSIDSKQDDASNREVDTRIFGTKQNILYGDNTLDKRSVNLNDRFNNLYNLLIAYQSVVNYARNNFNGELQINNLDKGVASKINLFKNNNDAEGLEKWATTAYERVYQTLSGIAYKRGRINAVDDDSKKLEDIIKLE